MDWFPYDNGLKFSDDFSWNKSLLIRLTSLNIRSEIWTRFLININ